MLLCLNSNVIMKFSCDYGENHWTYGWLQSVILFFCHLAIKGSTHKKAPAPCHLRHTNDRKIWIEDLNISSLAICRSLCSIFRAMFIKITQVFFTAARLWGRDSVGYYARSYYSERKVFKFKIYIPGKTKLEPGRLCYFCDGQEAKYCYYKLKSLRNLFRLKCGWRLVFREVII